VASHKNSESSTGLVGSRWQQIFFGRHPLRTFTRIAILVLSSFLVFKFILVPVKLTGNSMDPTFCNGQNGFINKLAYVWEKPKRGDIVGFRVHGDKQIIIKRIIGMPGERIAFHSGEVFINGKGLAEPYLAAKGAWEWPEEALGDNVYFVTGDNRVISQQIRIQPDEILGTFHRWRF